MINHLFFDCIQVCYVHVSMAAGAVVYTVVVYTVVVYTVVVHSMVCAVRCAQVCTILLFDQWPGLR